MKLPCLVVQNEIIFFSANSKIEKTKASSKAVSSIQGILIQTCLVNSHLQNKYSLIQALTVKKSASFQDQDVHKSINKEQHFLGQKSGGMSFPTVE